MIILSFVYQPNMTIKHNTNGNMIILSPHSNCCITYYQYNDYKNDRNKQYIFPSQII